MLILHTADIHLGELPGPVSSGQNLRMIDTLGCMAHVMSVAREEKPDAILIAGDLFHKSKLWADPMLEQIRLAANWLRELGEVAPTVLLLGTENHDNPAAFATIARMSIPGVRVVAGVRLFTVETAAGPLQVATVPGFDKGHFRTLYPGIDPAEENAQCSKLLGDIVLGLGAQLDPGIPSVLVAHYAVAGVEFDNGQTHIFHQSEVTLPTEALAAAPFDLVCLGHIHRMQRVFGVGGKRVYYSGSINRISFNEEGQSKGFWIHEFKSAEGTGYGTDEIDSRFIRTPAREFQTVSVFKDHLFDWPGMFADDPEAALQKYIEEIDPVKGAIVRLHYGCDEEVRKRMNHKAIEKALYDAGAFWVQEIKPVQITAALSKQEMHETAGPAENLVAWLLAEGFEADETQALLQLARPLIDTVSARTPTGKLSGVFIPKRLEVRNYRSYPEAQVDFSKISFATVNGPNGVGKSALFMDAISDCLFEETREGDLDGWLMTTSGIKATSGSITFEFAMGSTDWRVVRTRARSGKITLALQEWTGEKWADRSGTIVRETQQKIEALLGMDCRTFQCCGLIMQENYGLFLEADREDRMQVLGSILGLGAYEVLEKLAKEKVTETNRQLAAAKAKLAELDEKLKAKPGVKQDLRAVESDLADVANNIGIQERKQQEAEDLVRKLEAKRQKAEELEPRLFALADEIAKRNEEKQGHWNRVQKAAALLDREGEILEKAQDYERVKEQAAVLRAKKPRLAELNAQVDNEQAAVDDAGKLVSRLALQIGDAEVALSNRAELEAAAAEYRDKLARLNEMDELAERWRVLDSQAKDADRKYFDTKHALDTRIATLGAEKKVAQDKAAMLNDSGCIDPEKALCRFLADARVAAARATEIGLLLSEISTAEVDALAAEVDELIRAREHLGYSSLDREDVKERVKHLRPQAEAAAELGARAQLLESLRGQKAQAEADLAKAQERLQAVLAERHKLAFELAPLTTMEVLLPKLQRWAEAKEKLSAAKEASRLATEAIDRLEQEIKAKEDERQQLDRERVALSHQARELPQARDLRRAIQDALRLLQEQQNTLHGRKGGLEAQLQALDRDSEERRRVAGEMEPLAQAVIRYQTLTRAFGQDGIPFAVVRAVVPELAAQANEILSQMTGGKMSLEMRTERVQKSNKKEVNTLEIWITDYVRGSLPYKSRSGGQKVKAALSVAFALADLKARRAGIQLGMMFVDEPPFLDGEGTDAYCDALELMASRYDHMRVIAISHDPRMKARFPQTIEVEDLGEEGSRVKLIA